VRGFNLPLTYFLEPPPGVWFLATAPPMPMVDGVLKPGAKLSEGEPFYGGSFPIHELPGMIGNPQTPAIAARLRALLEEMEGSR
jgi:hypothetical protein